MTGEEATHRGVYVQSMARSTEMQNKDRRMEHGKGNVLRWAKQAKDPREVSEMSPDDLIEFMHGTP